MKFISHKKIIPLIISVVLISFFSKIVFAAWNGLPYNPGSIDNPECLPSQINCDVLPSIITELDPVFITSQAFSITGTDISNWDTAYGWGNHATVGYVTGTPWTGMGYITDGNTGWDNTYGFITSYTETDPIFTAWDKSTGISIAESQISDLQNYLTSYTETDPLFESSSAHSISSTDITNLSNLSGVNTGDQNLLGLVPYTGATTNVDLGVHNFTVDTNTLFVDSVNHRLGIGTTTPGYKLDVSGTIKSSSQILIGNVDASQIAITELGIKGADSTQAWIWDTAGVAAYTEFLFGDNGSNGYYGGFTRYSNSYSGSLAGQLNIENSGKKIFITTLPASSRPDLVIDSTGNVGIGTTTPTSLLHIVGGDVAVAKTSGTGGYSGTGAVALNVNTTSGAAKFFATSGTGIYDGAYFNATGQQETWFGVRTNSNTSGKRVVRFGNKTDKFAVQVLNDASDTMTSEPFSIEIGAPTGSLYLKNNGNIGIGTTGPGARLHLYSTGGANSGLLVEATSASSYGTIDMKNSSGDLAQFNMTGSSFTNGLFGSREMVINSAAPGGLTMIAYDVGGVIKFGTGGYAVGNERMRITNTGNVGIGTTTPAALLDVKVGAISTDVIRTTASNGNLTFKIRNDSGNNGTALLNGTGTILLTSNASDPSYFNAGSVGIGTTNPNGKLEVVGSTYLNSGTLGGTLSDTIFLGTTNFPNTYLQKIQTSASSTSSLNKIVFSTNTGDGTTYNNVLAIAGNNVGIGTTSPSQPLDIKAPINTEPLWIRASNGYSIIRFVDLASTTKAWVGNDTGSDFSFKNFTSGSNLSLVTTGTGNTLIPNGNVGIGTTTPAYKLEVKGLTSNSGVRSDMGFDIYQVPAPTLLTGVVSAGGSVDTGLHGYYITYTTALGETTAYGPSQITTTAGNNTVTLTIPVSTDPRVTGRKIYRTKAGTIYNEYLIANIANNTATSFVDMAADSTLTTGYQTAYYRTNSTSPQITLNGSRAMFVDANGLYLGTNAGLSVTSGGYNTFLGTNSGYNNTTANSNTFLGYLSGGQTTTGGNNVYVGTTVAYGNTTGYSNVAIGFNTGRYQADGATALTTANNSVYIGFRALGFNNSDTNSIVIGSQAIGLGSNSVVLGNDSITKTVLKGNVGIGTTEPGQKLEVGGNVSMTSGGYLMQPDVWGMKWKFAGDSDTVEMNSVETAWKFNVAAGGVTKYRFNTTKAGSINGPILDLGLDGNALFYGNVGIGTMAPGAKIHVVGDGSSLAGVFQNDQSVTTWSSTYAAFNMANANATTNNHALFSFSDNTGVSSTAGIGAKFTDRTNHYGDLYFYTKSTDGYNQRLYIQANGNVGIGTTAPSGKLEISHTGSESALILRRNDASYSNGIIKWQDSAGNTEAAIGTYQNSADTTGALEFFTGGSLGTTKMSILGSGNVGIGTTNPIYKLDVKGTSALSAISSDLGYNINTVVYPGVPSGIVSSGGSLGDGTYYYFLSYYTLTGETNTYPSSPLVTTPGNNTVTITLPISNDNRVIGRKLYRTKVGGGHGSEYLLATIANNTATSFIDTAADASLTGTQGLAYNRPNTTSNYITLNGNRILLTDVKVTSLGVNAGANVTSGGLNTFLGYSSGVNNTSGSYNTFTGSSSGYYNTTGFFNTAYGVSSALFLTTGTGNTMLGYNAGRFQADGTTSLQTPSYSVYVGYDSRGLNNSDNNSIVIGYSAVGVGANSVVLGNDNIIKTILKGNVGIGTSNPSVKLEINQSAHSSGYKLWGYDTRSTEWGSGYINSEGFYNIDTSTRFQYRVGGILGMQMFNSGGVPRMDIYSDASSSRYLTFGGTVGMQYNYTDSKFYIDNASTTKYLTIVPATGNIGVGTSNPDEKFVINTGSGLFRFKDYLMTYSDTLSLMTLNNGDLNLGTNTGTGVLTFKTNAIEKMRINSIGNVGIGNNSPTVGLELGSATAGLNQIINSTIGPELAPSFDPANWTATNGWSADGAGTQLTKVTNAAVGTITPSGSGATPTAGVTYKIVITATATSGQISYYFGGTTGGTGYPGSIITATTITDYLTAVNTSKLVISGAIGSTATITSVSIKALTSGTGDLTVSGNLRTNKVAYFNSGQFNPTIYLNNTIYLQGGYGGNPSLLYINAGVTAPSMYLTSGFIQLGASTAGSALLQKGSTNNTTEIRGGTSTDPQIFRVYNTYTSGTNYERLSIGQVSNVITFASEAAGAGVLRNFNFTGGNIGIKTTSPSTELEIGSSDLGDGLAGPIITLGRNTNATNSGAGSINFLDKGGLNGYVWQDAAGNMRINNATPTTLNDTAGIVIGAQTSERSTKQDIEDYTDYSSALSLIVNAPLHTFRYIREVSGYGPDSPLAKAHIGYIADEVDPIFMSGNVIDQVSVNGLLMASIKELNLTLEDIAIPVDDTNKSFIERFYEKMITWLGSPDNGLEQICMKKSDGSEFCVNGDQLEQAVNGLSNTTTIPVPVVTTPDQVVTPTPDLIVEPIPDPIPEPDPVVIPDTTPTEPSNQGVTDGAVTFDSTTL